MRRKFSEEKPTNVSIRNERKSISNSINVFRQEKEFLEARVKTLKVDTQRSEATVKGMEEHITSLNDIADKKALKVAGLDENIKQKTGELKDLLTSIEKLEKDRDEGFKKQGEEMSVELKESRAKLSEVVKETEDVEAKKDKALKEKVDVDRQINLLKYQQKEEARVIFEKKREIKEIVKELQASKKELEELKPKVSELKSQEEQLDKEVLDLAKEVNDKTIELKSLESKRAEKMEKVEEKEKVIASREVLLKGKEESLNVKEEHILALGKTLQEHFDKHEMKHIRVFK